MSTRIREVEGRGVRGPGGMVLGAIVFFSFSFCTLQRLRIHVVIALAIAIAIASNKRQNVPLISPRALLPRFKVLCKCVSFVPRQLQKQPFSDCRPLLAALHSSFLPFRRAASHASHS